MLQYASQHEGLPWSYLNVLLVYHFVIGDGLRTGRQSYVAESSAHIRNKWSRFDLQNSRMPEIQTCHVLLWFLFPALHVFSWKDFIPCLKLTRVKREVCKKMFVFTFPSPVRATQVWKSEYFLMAPALPRLTWQCWVYFCLGMRRGEWKEQEDHTAVCPAGGIERHLSVKGNYHTSPYTSCILCFLCNIGKHRPRRTVPRQQKQQQMHSSPVSDHYSIVHI